MKTSKNYVKGKFKNLVTTKLSLKESEGMMDAMIGRFRNGKERFPQIPMKTKKFDKDKFEKMDEAYSWFGHSSLLFKIEGKTIVVDPVFGRASFVSCVGPKSFPMDNPPRIEDLPKKIDLVLITHDHFDHLEKQTLNKIHENTKMFFVPLGVKKLLVKWGVPENKIKEFDWYDSKKYESLELIFTSSRHFAGRSLTNRNQTLWGGWVIKSNQKRIYISGDSGYFNEFERIGKDYGPFDIVFVENGQYNKAWKDIHMIPEESVQAGIDSRSKVLFPVHWGKYDLSLHSWQEPIERFQKEAKKKIQIVATPQIGEIFGLEKIPKTTWWK